jgi:hypothetical protein
MRRRERAVVTAALSLGLLGGGVAFAAWLTSGTGDLAGQAGAAVELVVTPAPGSADLFPGSTGALAGTVTNPNSYPVTVTEVSYQEVAARSSNPATCPNGTVTLAAGAPTVTALTIGAGATAPIVLPGALAMAADAPTGCQNQTFLLRVTVTQPGT